MDVTEEFAHLPTPRPLSLMIVPHDLYSTLDPWNITVYCCGKGRFTSGNFTRNHQAVDLVFKS